MKPKIKITNINEEEIKSDDDNLSDTIKEQNRIAINEGFHMRIVKRMGVAVVTEERRKKS